MSLPEEVLVGPARSPALDRALTALAAAPATPSRARTGPSLGGAELPLGATIEVFGDHTLVRLRRSGTERELCLGGKLTADGLVLDVRDGSSPDAVREAQPYQVALRDRHVLARLFLGSAVAALARSQPGSPTALPDPTPEPPADGQLNPFGLPAEGYRQPWKLMTWKPTAIQPGPGGVGRFTLSWPHFTFPGAFQSSGPAAAEEARLLGLYEALFRAELTQLARKVALEAIRAGFRGHPAALLTAATAATDSPSGTTAPATP